MPKKITFEEARKRLKNKFNYLELLEFNGNEKIAKILDTEYGAFDGNYRSVYRGQSNHKNRAKTNKKNRTKQTNLKKYGVENVFQSEIVKEKIKQTNLEKYGVENISQSEEIKNKKINTYINKFGYEHPMKCKSFKNRIEQIFIKKYGHKTPFKNTEIKQKIKNTNMKRYGTEYPQQNKNISLKKEQTNLEKYGVRHVTQNKKIYNKIKKTNIKKYGSKRALDNVDVFQKSQNSNIENGNWYNINGKTLLDYYKKSKFLHIRSYSTIQQQFKINKFNALNTEYYNELSGKSRIANKWLNKIENDLRYSLIKEYHIPNTLFHADGYDPKTNTIYEFYGDFWHGNLEKFAAEETNPITKTSFQDLYDKTMERQNLILDLGYNVVYTWESTFNVNICN